MNLVIGYGNTLRGDDAVGPLVAEAIDEWRLPGVRTLSVHQLTPELAADIATTRRVIFIDAASPATQYPEEQDVSFLRLQPEAGSLSQVGLTHHLNPCRLLALSGALYGGTPEAYLLTVPAEDFDVRVGADAVATLSATTRAGMERALTCLRAFLMREPDTAAI